MSRTSSDSGYKFNGSNYLRLFGKGGLYSCLSYVEPKDCWKYAVYNWKDIYKERGQALVDYCADIENIHGEAWSSIFDMDAISVDDENYNECCYREVTPREYYEDIFKPDDIESYLSRSSSLHMELTNQEQDRKPTPIVSFNCSRKGYDVLDKRGWYQKNWIMFNDYDALEKTINNRFALCSMCSYLGKHKTAHSAYKLHGYCIDLDYVTIPKLNNLFLQISNGVIPRPTYIVNSGHGLHIVYVFEKPIPLYPRFVNTLQTIKKRLTDMVWNEFTSCALEHNERTQFQGIYQCFRMVGSWCKFDSEVNKTKTTYTLKAYKVGSKVSLSYLNDVCNKFRETWRRASAKNRFDALWHDKITIDFESDYSSWDVERLTLDEAKELYPDWYARRVVNKEDRGHWLCNEGLYYWWLDALQNSGQVQCGHRYFCIGCLFIYGMKCAIPFEQVMGDAMNLVDSFNALSDDEGNSFTVEDVEAAAKFWDEKYFTVSVRGAHGIKAMSGFSEFESLVSTKRNGRTRNLHLKVARFIRSENSSYENVGRPKGSGTKQDLVRNWRKQNPNGTKYACQKELGLSKHTVYKWWDLQNDLV